MIIGDNGDGGKRWHFCVQSPDPSFSSAGGEFYSRCDSFSPISSTMLLQRCAEMVDDDFGDGFISVLFVSGVSSGW